MRLPAPGRRVFGPNRLVREMVPCPEPFGRLEIGRIPKARRFGAAARSARPARGNARDWGNGRGPARSRPIHNVKQPSCQTAKRNPPRPRSAPRVAGSCSPPWHGGRLPSQAEGAERRVAPRVFRCTPWRACASFGEGRCALRRSARRFTAPGSHFALTALRAFALRNAFEHWRSNAAVIA